MALVVTIGSAPPAIFNDDARFIFKRSVAHVGHGGANIFAGVIEAIPVARNISAGVREQTRAKDTGRGIPEANFIRYEMQTVFTDPDMFPH